MVNIVLPTNEERRLSFFLAMEEYVARCLDVGEAFFVWRVPASVIFGRNQLVHNEVNIGYCKDHGIGMYRRKSGGGCVYADMGNLMMSFIAESPSVQFTYHQYVMLVLGALKSLGIQAKATGRNDLMVGEGKVSGSAFYHVNGKGIVHGTLLYDTDTVNMSACLTPDSRKMESKGVKSVRQRISLLKDHTSLSLDEIERGIVSHLCKEQLLLKQEEVEKIEELEKTYLSEDFIWGSNPRCTIVRKRYINNVGLVEARMDVKGGRIRDIDLKGDYIVLGDVEALCARLKGVELTPEAVRDALPEDLSDIIYNLNNKELTNLITETYGE
jgi:lipoic acid synthetase/lipoate-protein ligase A